jgi:hypothetical protein
MTARSPGGGCRTRSAGMLRLDCEQPDAMAIIGAHLGELVAALEHAHDVVIVVSAAGVTRHPDSGSRRHRALLCSPDNPGGGLSVDRVRLAGLPAGAPVWRTGLHHGEVLIQQVARSGRRRSGRWLPSRPCPAARAGSASPAAASTAAFAVSRELLVAEQPSLLVQTAGWWVRPWVSTAPMTTWCAWACWGVAVALGHEPGQAPAGRDGHTSDRAWRTGAYQVTGARPAACRFTRPCRAGQQLPG